MTSHFNNRETQDSRSIQSFYEPALRILDDLMEIKKETLRKRSHSESNAMVSKAEFSAELSKRLRINAWTTQQIITSLVKSNSVIANVGFVKPKEGV